MLDKDIYYDVLISCPHAKNKNSIKKITAFNKHLLIHVGEREYRYQFDGKEHIMPGLLCTIYLPLPNNIKDISRWSVKNGLIHIKIRKYERKPLCLR